MEKQLALFPSEQENYKVSKVIKRSGRIVAFDREKITNAIFKAAVEVGGSNRELTVKVTDKVIRHAKQPTLVVRAREGAVTSDAQSLNRIVLPLDGSETSEAAIDHAVQLANALGVGVTLVRAIASLTYVDAYSDTRAAGYADLLEGAEADANSYVAAVARRIRGEGVRDVAEVVLTGSAGAIILDEACDSGESLVVMATHGRSGVGRWAMGSVADRVVRHCSGPVLVVRPSDAV